MQSVSSAFTTAAAAAANQPTFSALISWLKTYNSAAIFFQIGTSAINGPDIIPGGATVTLFDKYNYVEETANVNSINIERVVSTIPIGVMSAQLDIEFNNTSKRYLPTYDATIGNYIKPGRPIKVNMGFSGENMPQFVGYSGRPRITLGNRILSIHAFDAMEYINSTESSLGMQTDVMVHDLIAMLLQEVGFTSSQYVLDASLQNAIHFVAPNGKKIGTLIRDLVESELGVFFIDEQGIARFWNRYHFNSNPAAVGTLTYSNIVDLTFVDTPVINHVRVTTKPRTVMDSQPVWLLSGYITVPAGGTTEYIGSFSDQDGELPVINIQTPIESDEILTNSFYSPTTDTDGTSSAAGTVALDSFYTFGTSFAATFSNAGSSEAYITRMSVFGQPAKVTSKIVEEYKDQTSIDDNGLNPDDGGVVKEVSNDYLQDAATAQAYAYILVTAYNQPRRQMLAPIFPNPAYQFGDVVNVTIEDTNETLKTVVLGNRIGMSPNSPISQSLTLEARDFTSYFQIGVSAINGTHSLAP
jgi:hypothetical protein